MSSFKDNFSGSWMLTGERLATYERVLKLDLLVVIPCALMVYLLVSFGYSLFALVPLLIIVVSMIIRVYRKETLWQLKRQELQTGKTELKGMKQDMEKLISTHKKSKKEHIR